MHTVDVAPATHSTVAIPLSSNGALTLPTKQVMRLLGIARSTLYRLIKSGEFPRPIKVGPGKNGWLATDLEGYLSARIAARGV